ncbi:MAG TPA: glycosyltransferase family 4 protein [Ilumatobacteraceae bacterium]|nr:glycosyltransferase family 4 protein [Ilumatobacteraceae bacterium]
MRVLMLSWEYPPGAAGGMAAHVDGLSRAMASAGHDVVLFTRTNPACAVDEVVNGVRVVRADVDMPWLRADVEVARAASANHAFVARSKSLGDWVPDIVHAHDWHVGWAAEVLSTVFDVPLVTTLHGTERGRHGGHLPFGEPTDINAVEWWLAFRSSRVITSTRLMVREITGGFELDPAVVRRIPNGIDPTWWRVGARDEAAEAIECQVDDVVGRGGAGTATPRPVVFTWGRVQYEKGFQVLARAMATLRTRVPGIVCVIAGRGSYLPELQSQIDLEGVSDIVQLPGFLPDDELRSAIHRANCVVIPSLYEPFGLVALEALAANAALIVADTGGLAELVGGTGSALMFEPGNADELAERIEHVLTEPEAARAMRRRANELLDATYSWDAIASRTIDVYAEVAASRVNVR